MLKVFCAAVGVLMLLTAASLAAQSQSILEEKLSVIVDGLPKPPDSLTQAMDIFGHTPLGEVPSPFGLALGELNRMQYIILQPLFETLQKTAKQHGLSYSPEEQKILQDVQTMDKAWGEGVIYGFSARIEYRPGISKQFWSRPKQQLSASAEMYYSQLEQIEKDLDGLSFLRQAKEREGLVFQDARLDHIDAERMRALSEVPLKKIKFAEGSDVMVDLPDREKTIEVMKQFDAKKISIFKMVYQQQYRWWQTNYARVAAAGKKLDAILTATEFGHSLSGNDTEIKSAIADVQARVIGMLIHLTNIGTKIISISQQAAMVGQATEDYVRSMNVPGT